ncbi:dynamin family protein [Phlyctema vagabunda]|uniref:Dynamin family protein n=1 Tax=Phlyctema vagabunda TaxID=108571 RepID=A0ABR4PLP8_9HELO
MDKMETTMSLEGLQTEEQRQVLDIVAQSRKCGLEGILSLPQLVVCGDQSAGKSSVLEALTEIPFPRNDNLCTRFATEIILKRADRNSLTIKVIPDSTRPVSERNVIEAFNESITDFSELPKIMNHAMGVMGLDSSGTSAPAVRAFARDVLSIEIEGPSRPQLTLVDIPGLIATDTKGVTKADVAMVTEITDHYISQPRTICLAVISSLNDYANQKILTKVRDVDPEGNRTLGIIKKPDRLEAGSGSEKAFIELAQNEDVFFKLGWHVLKNRSFKEGDTSFLERNEIESAFFRTSNFKTLAKDTVGIETLRRRLATLLFDHVKRELPNLRQEIEEALADTKNRLTQMGTRRSNYLDCRSYLSDLNLQIYEVCKSAVHGYYEGAYFHKSAHQGPLTLSRLRAVVQYMNTRFAENVRLHGKKYNIKMDTDGEPDRESAPSGTRGARETSSSSGPITELGKIEKLVAPKHPAVKPVALTRAEALAWVKKTLVSTRGQELSGDFNPLLVGELFWEQSSKWQKMAEAHIEQVEDVCKSFLDTLLREKSPEDVRSRMWAVQIVEPLKARSHAASRELNLIMDDFSNYPINYNHYYTETIHKRRRVRLETALSQAVDGAKTPLAVQFGAPSHMAAGIDVAKVISSFSKANDPDMENFSCEEALDRLFAIYKVHEKTFVANVTTQVVERHIVHGLEQLFSPVVVNKLTEAQILSIACEAPSAKRQREFLQGRIEKLEEGHEIFKGVMGSVQV